MLALVIITLIFNSSILLILLYLIYDANRQSKLFIVSIFTILNNIHYDRQNAVTQNVKSEDKRKLCSQQEEAISKTSFEELSKLVSKQSKTAVQFGKEDSKE
jgi:hypothetical protein